MNVRLKAALKAEAEREAAITSGPTFKQFADQHIENKLKGFRNRTHRRRWQYQPRNYAYPIIGHLPLAQVNDMHQAIAILAPHWNLLPRP